MVKVEWAITPVEDDFELWYRQAIERGFCQNVPKNIYQYSKEKFWLESAMINFYQVMNYFHGD
ncbi:hypothetical protein BV375_17530 [Nostoc sp. 106C]|nr:hypothetical protein BV375_17530 [Nostoc sp. 106C]